MNHPKHKSWNRGNDRVFTIPDFAKEYIGTVFVCESGASTLHDARDGRSYSAQINENEHKGDRLIDENTAISPQRRLTRNNESSLRRRVSLCTAWCAQTVWTGQWPTSFGVCINVATGSATDRGSGSRCTVNSGTCLMYHGRKVNKPRREKGVLI